jgi:hypothetical protein
MARLFPPPREVVELIGERMFFTPDQIAKMAAEYSTISQRCQDLVEAFMKRAYAEKQAREYALHGFARRLYTLVACINLVFEKLPPERDQLPTREERLEATIGIQAFVFNAFGSIDNLAWIFAIEKAIKNKRGDPINRNAIGLAAHNIAIREKLSENFQNYLKGKDEWFKNLEDFRHALAHRVPLFVPPYIITQDKLPEYDELQVGMNEAIAKRDFDTYERKSNEQDALGVFRPWMLHSVVETEAYIVFHPQLFADFATVEEIGRKMLAELDLA